jgi:osmotically inducible protein OsmC
MTDQREQGIIRTARVSWLTHPPAGHAQVSVGSRAFTALRLSFVAAEAEPEVTTPGELLAASFSGAMTLILARLLDRAGTPARELTATTAIAFTGDWYEIESVELAIQGRVDGIDDAAFDDAARGALRRCGESLGLPAGDSVALTAQLAPS